MHHGNQTPNSAGLVLGCQRWKSTQSTTQYQYQNSKLRDSIHFFHLRSFVSSTLNFLKWGQVIIIAETLIVVINAEAELNHAVDASSKLCGFIEVKSRGEKRCVEKKPDKILDSFVRFISCCFLLEFR